LGFYQQVMRSAECGDNPPGLFFGFLLASGFDQEPLQAFSYAGGSHGEGIGNRQRSLARRQVASALRVPEAFKVVAHLDEHTQIIPEFGIGGNLVCSQECPGPAGQGKELARFGPRYRETALPGEMASLCEIGLLSGAHSESGVVKVLEKGEGQFSIGPHPGEANKG
jgi:hypothetical protein